ncbi:MAG TPA: ATP-binding cassette domain-containing protein [Cyclobacteriaceae bacterium]|nr:ATP-binding cassette domain-containing protein [Cyclobacteriaceae bacterium]HRK53078.1 ATP-binding cassette domain-containing protein [Cyclobacteriaceae bacterium]
MMTQKNNIQTPVIEIKDLHKSFGNNHVLRGFDFTLMEGENVALLGKSGSGKSVLIKCLIGLIKIDSGQMRVLGQSVPDMTQKELDAIRRDVGFLFQGSALYDSMSVRENLEFPMRRHHEKDDGSKTLLARVEEALDSVGLLHTLDLMPSELSGGMKKRVAIARTLILQPKIILYDEPTGGLDPITGREISYLINKVQEQYKTSALIITHDLACAKISTNRIVILSEGKNYIEGSYDELERSSDPVAQEFFKK